MRGKERKGNKGEGGGGGRPPLPREIPDLGEEKLGPIERENLEKEKEDNHAC